MATLQSLFQQILRMRWSDYVDIALVAFLIYKLLPLVRNPSTMRIVRAILGVVIVAWAAVSAGAAADAGSPGQRQVP